MENQRLVSQLANFPEIMSGMEDAAVAHVNTHSDLNLTSWDEVKSAAQETREAYVVARETGKKVSPYDKAVMELLKSVVDFVICGSVGNDRIVGEGVDEPFADITANGKLGEACIHDNPLCLHCYVPIAEKLADRARWGADVVATKAGVDAGVWQEVTVTMGKYAKLTTALLKTDAVVASVKAAAVRAGGKVTMKMVETPIKFLGTSDAQLWPHAHMLVWTPKPLSMDSKNVHIKELPYQDYESVLGYNLKGGMATSARMDLKVLLDPRTAVNPVEALYVIGAAIAAEKRGECSPELGNAAIACQSFIAEWMNTFVGVTGSKAIKTSVIMDAPRRVGDTGSKFHLRQKNTTWAGFDRLRQRGIVAVPAAQSFKTRDAWINGELESDESVDELWADFDNAPEIAVMDADDLAAMMEMMDEMEPEGDIYDSSEDAVLESVREVVEREYDVIISEREIRRQRHRANMELLFS